MTRSAGCSKRSCRAWLAKEAAVAENVAEIPVQRPTDQCVVQTAGLRKSYDGLEALRGLDLEVPRGSITGFLGRNGAGKTTAIKILLGMTRPTAGLARVLGYDAA